MGAKLERAARIDDTIEHSRSFFGALAGFIVGAAIGIAIVATFAVTGPLLLIAGAALLCSGIGQYVGKFFKHDHGDIATGAKTVTVGGRTRWAARVKDEVRCHDEVIVSGCLRIYIELLNATRETEETRCDGKIKKDSACETVYYGGESVQVMPKRWTGELPGWFYWGREVIGLVAMGAGIRALWKGWAGLSTFARIAGTATTTVGVTDKGLLTTQKVAESAEWYGTAGAISNIRGNPVYRTVLHGSSLFGFGRSVSSRAGPMRPWAQRTFRPTPPPSRIITPQAPQIIVPQRQVIVPQRPQIITPARNIIVPKPPTILQPPTPKLILPGDPGFVTPPGL